MEIKKLAKNTAILASPKILIFFIGILKSKVIALYLGTGGFGIIEQLTRTINQIRQSTLSFMPDGMVKLLAQERADEFRKNVIGDIIKTYFLMVIPLIIFICASAVIFADELTIFILGDIEYRNYFLISLIGLPISFLVISLRSFLKAFKEVKSIAWFNVIQAIVNVIIFIPLVYFLKVKGGVYSITITFITSLILIFYLVRKNVFQKYKISFDYIRNAIFSKLYFKELLTFISVGIVAGAFRVFENIASRSIVVNELGIDKIGIYSSITKWQALFIGFILPSIFTYLYPRISESKTNKEIVMVINDVIRMITFLTLPFILVGISTRQWIIPLFYSNEFMEASVYLPYHFSFLLMAVWGTIFEQIFAPTGRLKTFLIFIISIYSLSLLMVYYFIPKFGLYGYLLKFTLTPLLTAIAFFIYWRMEISFKLRKENLQLVMYAIFCASISILFRNFSYALQLSLALLLLGSLMFFLRQKEKNFILKKIKGIFNRRN